MIEYMPGFITGTAMSWAMLSSWRAHTLKTREAYSEATLALMWVIVCFLLFKVRP